MIFDGDEKHIVVGIDSGQDWILARDAAQLGSTCRDWPGPTSGHDERERIKALEKEVKELPRPMGR